MTAAALLSDGASRLVDHFGMATWRELPNLLADNGPAELIRRTREAEKNTASNREHHGKIHDDATAVYCRVLT